MSSIAEEKVSLSTLLKKDSIKVEILPQKRGYLKKHVEYDVQSARFKSEVKSSVVLLFSPQHLHLLGCQKILGFCGVL